MRLGKTFAVLALLAAGLAACNSPTTETALAPATSQNGVTLIIRFEASDKGLAELKSILDGVSDAMKSEAGFVSAKVYRNIDEPNIFVLEEVWTTKELHFEHFDRINQSGDWAHIESLLVAEPQMGYYSLDAAGAE
ncbi:putative quinol monooxygenase [Altererythrobacter litoralis]|uniref:Antibiotic biosynthesis monooxygenase n=1 Tax=Altererythrobacter litoralis TaxID=3113904 RepID=A0ABU7GHF4_9SPHN|nr:antibiotic biosynthesis monooxygenase [Erythrobacteraceae bacterium 1XM1-14]